MLGYRIHVMGLLAGLLMAGPALAAPAVVVLGGGSDSDDPVAACGDLAASPWEPSRNGRGLADDQIFIDGAIAACEAALAASPQSPLVAAWLARAYILAGRSDDAAALLQPAIDAGNAFAAYLLAGLVAVGGAPELQPDAVSLLVQAADGGYAPAQSELGERYETGDGVAGDYAEAARLYRLAAEQGYGLASYKLGVFAHFGYLAAADYDRAAALYRQAVAAGAPQGNYGLGQMYEYGNGVDQDYSRAAEFYQLGAEAREKMAETALAYLYEQGLGVAQDYDRSFALLTDASGQNWSYAHAALSIHYLFGEGTDVDADKAFELAWLARSQGVTYAEGIVGYMYQNGLGTVRDLANALFHFENGASGGDQYSDSQLPVVQAEIACQDAAGSPYEPGSTRHGRPFAEIDADDAIAACENAVDMNPQPVGNRVWLARAYARAGRYADALPLLEEGVAAGNALAHTLLGTMLMTGAGVDEDPARAVELYRAVAADFGEAQLALGLAYEQGIGVAADRAQALYWLRLAQSFGVAEAEPEIIALLADRQDAADGVDLAGFGREGPAY